MKKNLKRFIILFIGLAGIFITNLGVWLAENTYIIEAGKATDGEVIIIATNNEVEIGEGAITDRMGREDIINDIKVHNGKVLGDAERCEGRSAVILPGEVKIDPSQILIEFDFLPLNGLDITPTYTVEVNADSCAKQKFSDEYDFILATFDNIDAAYDYMENGKARFTKILDLDGREYYAGMVAGPSPEVKKVFEIIRMIVGSISGILAIILLAGTFVKARR